MSEYDKNRRHIRDELFQFINSEGNEDLFAEAKDAARIRRLGVSGEAASAASDLRDAFDKRLQGGILGWLQDNSSFGGKGMFYHAVCDLIKLFIPGLESDDDD